MKSKIRVLTEDTINKIAAGEVIENPASVVKELVENAIDAGASDICVEIQGGGRQLIRVSDDGCGMNADDALLSLERHATSKIREIEDVHSVTTMGFRGEAIPSIASISKFMLLTCPKPEGDVLQSCENTIGTMVMVDGGKIISCAPAARSPGTTIEVKSLFFNVPVRKKFLKSPAVDANETLKMMSTIALGYPDLKFRLISDGKQLLMASPAHSETCESKFQARVDSVLGWDYLQNSVFLECGDAGMGVHGVVGLPGYTRHNRSGQYLFINHRAVFSPVVAYAIKEGYGTALAAGRHPVFVLHLSLAGGLVDVNVHPQKKEVRLRQEQLLKDLIIKAIRQTLHKNLPNISSLPSTQTFAEPWSFEKLPDRFPESSDTFHRADSDRSFQTQSSPFSKEADIHLTSKNELQFMDSARQETPQQRQNRDQSVLPLQSYQQPAAPRVIATIPRYILLDANFGHELASNDLAKANNSPAKGGLFLIDQKAAHSRVIFEKLQQNQSECVIATQTLLIPITIEVTPVEAELLRSALYGLNQMGIEIQEFGRQTFLINAIPEIFGNSDIQRLISDIIHALEEEHGGRPFHEERNKRIAMAASRAAVSYERRLSTDEAQLLVNQLWKCLQPYQCPQGRPTLIQLSPEELAKQFQK